MLGLSANLNYYLFNGNVDLRKGIFRLWESVREEMSLYPSDVSNVYMFMSRNRKVVKILHYERGFYVLYEKRPVMGKFTLALLLLVPETLHADLPRTAQVGAFRHGGHDDDFDLRKGALDPSRRIQPAFAAARDHIHQDQIYRQAQTVHVRQRSVVDGERHLEVLRGLNPQLEQLAGHGLILDDHDLVFHGVSRLSCGKVSVSSKCGAYSMSIAQPAASVRARSAVRPLPSTMGPDGALPSFR